LPAGRGRYNKIQTSSSLSSNRPGDAATEQHGYRRDVDSGANPADRRRLALMPN
jgi:hypothetical protein